ncbi:hypothetical protein D9757_003099 [Collybiopsis confluens]|uniref:Uncharacterized protein n=1 Tax=Collybiopsis confluens TaxID=2823264 RepID=A0A8H5HX46_9AGAR|nr:hypothetical protein D9757_003099 [Collybiopsis confluens]
MSSQSAQSSSSSTTTTTTTKEAQARMRLIRRRKARLNTCFREECEDRCVSGEERTRLVVRFAVFMDERFSESETEFDEDEGGVDAFVADRRAWEQFKENFFPEPPLYIRVRIDSIVSSSTTTNNSIHPIPSSSPSPLPRYRTNDTKPKPVPVRKPGWRREPESLLLKGVLVSNAMGLVEKSYRDVRL